MKLKYLILVPFGFLLIWAGVRLLPAAAPFLAGTLLALAAEVPVGFLERRLRMPRKAAAAVGVSITFTLMALLTMALGLLLWREAGAVLPQIADAARSGVVNLRTSLTGLCCHAPRSIRPAMERQGGELLSDSTALMDRGMAMALTTAGSVLGRVPNGALGLGTAVLAGYMISARLPRIRRVLLEQPELETLRAFCRRIRDALGGWFRAQCRLMGVTFLVLSGGFFLLRIPYAPLLAAGISLVDALPVLGTGVVLVPWSALCFLRGDTALAIGLLGTYATAALLRSALEPKFLSRHLGLDPLVTLATMYGGFYFFGLTGMLLAPLLAMALTAEPE